MLISPCMRHAKSTLGWAVFSALLVGGAVACAASDAATFLDKGSQAPGAADAGEFGAREPTSNADLGPTDNGVIIVHAAGAPAFRLCFSNELDAQPTPNSELMPDANVVGVDVGSAVRVGPLKGPPGEVFLFSESLIRQSYPPGGGGPSCKQLLESTPPYPYTRLGTVEANLSRGVHLLVVRGCGPKNPIHAYTKVECGTDYDAEKGNLGLTRLEVLGTNRTSDNELPAQIVHLSQPLESYRDKRSFRVTFGDLTASPTAHNSKAENPTLNGEPLAFVTPPTFQATDIAAYNKLGFRVVVDDTNGQGKVVAEQSLADVQRLSAPREIPPTYYSLASNYVFLMLGDPAVKDDAGVGFDERLMLHLLAVPVITRPTAGDAGTDAAVGR
jgi:hypothetical protein